MARISIVTGGHFCTNPRVWREADALSAAGHEVTVIGVSYDPEQAELDEEMLNRRAWRYQIAADIRPGSWHRTACRTWNRCRSRLARSLLAANLCDPNALGYAANRLLAASIKQKADLTVVHLELATWVGTELHKRRLRVGADIEDWYSESRPDSDVPRMRFLRGLETEILKCSVHVTTTSAVMADALAARYGCTEPKVIYNSVPAVPQLSQSQHAPIRLIWFSQTLGTDRGLQDVFGALPLLEGNWRLELRANTSSAMHSWVQSQVPPALRSQVHIEPTVPPDDLASLVAEHDIGFAPEMPSCLNKALTISNKIFQYLQSGLLVAASDTPGQREALSMIPRGGDLYPPGDSVSLALLLNSWINDSFQLPERKKSISRQANERFAYEHQAKVLLESVNRALERKCLHPV